MNFSCPIMNTKELSIAEKYLINNGAQKLEDEFPNVYAVTRRPAQDLELVENQIVVAYGISYDEGPKALFLARVTISKEGVPVSLGIYANCELSDKVSQWTIPKPEIKYNVPSSLADYILKTIRDKPPEFNNFTRDLNGLELFLQ